MSERAEAYHRFTEALRTGEVVGIRYHGGSQPGTYREIVPLNVMPDRVIAWCRQSSASKFFLFDAIEFRSGPPASNEGVLSWAPLIGGERLVPTVAQMEAAHREALEALGWHVERVVGESGETLGLHRRSKVGKLLKHPTLTLSFEPMTYDLVVTREGGYEHANVRPRVRPWSVRGSTGGTGTWGDPGKALAAFMREAAKGP